MSKFNQETFNNDHLEPRDYGEGDYYVVADSFTTIQAAALIGEWESDLTGDKHGYNSDDIVLIKIFIGKNEDNVNDWCVNNFSDEKPVAWGKGVEL